MPRNLPYARNRIVECYLWAAVIHFEPQYPKGRSIVARVGALYAVIDDTFDAYGTIEELELLATAIERFVTTYINLFVYLIILNLGHMFPRHI